MLTPRQWLLIKGPIVDANNRLNRLFPSFNPFSSKFSSEDRLIDIFSCFSFHSVNRRSKEGIKVHIFKLNNITFQASTDSKAVVVVSDTSIKNQVATAMTHIYTHDSLVIKTIHHTINITLTEAELFAIRCESIKLPNYPTSIESLLLWIEYMLQRESLTYWFILTKYSHLSFPENLGISLTKIILIPLNSEIVQVMRNGLFII